MNKHCRKLAVQSEKKCQVIPILRPLLIASVTQSRNCASETLATQIQLSTDRMQNKQTNLGTLKKTSDYGEANEGYTGENDGKFSRKTLLRKDQSKN